MLPAISQVCSLPSPFEKDLADYAAGNWQHIELWFTKLEIYLQANSISAVQELASQNQLTFPVASFQGGLLNPHGQGRELAWELFNQRLQICQQLEIGTLVVACDILDTPGESDWPLIMDSLKQVADQAAQADTRVALEFQAEAKLGNNLQTTASLVAEINHPFLGICLDAFHFYVGPSNTEDLACLTSDNLFHVQLCDLADCPRELAKDGNRILPGEGDIPLKAILTHLSRINYQRHISIELMNPQLWQVPALQFGQTSWSAFNSLLQQAGITDGDSIST